MKTFLKRFAIPMLVIIGIVKIFGFKGQQVNWVIITVVAVTSTL